MVPIMRFPVESSSMLADEARKQAPKQQTYVSNAPLEGHELRSLGEADQGGHSLNSKVGKG